MQSAQILKTARALSLFVTMAASVLGLGACGQKGPLVLPPANVQAAGLGSAAFNSISSVGRSSPTGGTPTQALLEPVVQPPAAAMPSLIPTDPLFR